jgi:hypothetical protein
MNNKSNRLRYTIVLSWGTVLLFTNTVLGQAPSIVIAPVSQAIPQGCNAYLSVSVAGALPITYTWHRNFEFTNYYQVTLDSTNCTLVLTNMAPADACFFNLDTQNSYGYGPGKQVIVAVIASGMATNGFALTIRGLTNSVWTINCTTNVAPPNWFTLTNFSIPRNPPVFTYVDLAATNLSRFYQVIPTVY